MHKGFSGVTWEEAVRGFILHKKAVRAKGTARWYAAYTTSLMVWANAEQITLSAFTKRHLDAYLVHRTEIGRTPTTIHHDALVATVFTEWCKSNELLDRDPLAEYKVRNHPETYKYMPTTENVQKLLQGILDFFDLAKNPKARFIPPKQRSFHRDRNYAIEAVKIDTACRIGEIFGFKVSDFQNADKGKQLVVRKAKGRKPRILPVSPECAKAIEQWLKVRTRIMSNVPEDEDQGWLFLSETGVQILMSSYKRSMDRVKAFAGVPQEVTNHATRRYSLNSMATSAEGGLLFAQEMAGHTDPKTTLIYTNLSSDELRQKHEQVGVMRGVLVSNRTEKRKRLV